MQRRSSLFAHVRLGVNFRKRIPHDKNTPIPTTLLMICLSLIHRSILGFTLALLNTCTVGVKVRLSWIIAMLFIVGVGGYHATRSEDALRNAYQRPTDIPFPSSNLFSQEKYVLGKTLFFDPRLSSSNMMACASCHNPGLSWTDGNARAVGHGHKVLNRKTPTLLNVAWGSTFFWDGRAASLEEQALGPLSGAGEMNMKLTLLPQKLAKIEGYSQLFRKAFGDDEINLDRITKAIATFERTILSNDSLFDRWVAGEEKAISESAKRGFLVFNTKANCVSCHTGWRFTNGSFADIGLRSKDKGRGRHLFKTPTLRNISVRGPYMHDGSIETLSEVVEHYNSGGAVRRETTKLFLKPLHLSGEEKNDLVSFLETLTGEDGVVSAPSLPRVTRKGNVWETSKRRLASDY